MNTTNNENINSNICEESPKEESDYSFIQEKIKDRPVNRRKLVKRMLITGGLAIVFGLIACLTFIFLEPAFGKLLTGNSEMIPEQIVLPEVNEDTEKPVNVEISDSPFEEMQIEDMNYNDDVAATSENEAAELARNHDEEKDYELTLDEYQMLCRKMNALGNAVKKSMVTIISYKEGESYSFIRENRTSGIILCDNGIELMIFADSRNINNEDNILIRFCDDKVYEGRLSSRDSNTGLAVYSVNLSEMDDTTKEEYAECTLGSSSSSFMLGSPVLAVGNPLLTEGENICFGNVTSIDSYRYFPDAAYQMVTTDIYGDREGYGFLFNVRGQLIGIINQEEHREGLENLIYAYGISTLRALIEDLSNGKQFAYIGLDVNDVSQDVSGALSIPNGVYVARVINDSPAMNVGLLAGDIITRIDDNYITRVSDYMTCLRNLTPGQKVEVTVSRPDAGDYKEVAITLEIGEKK